MIAFCCTLLLFSLQSQGVNSFAVAPRLEPNHYRRDELVLNVAGAKGRHYGPPVSSSSSSSGRAAAGNDPEQKFRSLLEKIKTAEKTEHIPGLLTRNLDFLLGTRDLPIDSIVEEAKSDGDKATMEAVETVVMFVEEFVEHAQEVDKKHKELVGKIIKEMQSKDEGTLDEFFTEHRQELTPGFVRHLEGECERVANAPKVTKDSSRMLELLYTIQTRVLEELGKDIGEGALVLGQLLGYDDDDERVAVLEAGLRVRGLNFAKHMRELTQEALEGFTTVQGGVDPDLVERVKHIDLIIGDFVEEQEAMERNAFQ